MSHHHFPTRNELHRIIIARNIDRDKLGSRLTPAARQTAIDVGMSVFKGQMGNGQASDIGIKAALAQVLRPE